MEVFNNILLVTFSLSKEFNHIDFVSSFCSASVITKRTRRKRTAFTTWWGTSHSSIHIKSKLQTQNKKWHDF